MSNKMKGLNLKPSIFTLHTKATNHKVDTIINLLVQTDKINYLSRKIIRKFFDSYTEILKTKVLNR